MSRSQLYAAAIEEYLGRRRSKMITERLDEVYSGVAVGLDPSLETAQFKSLGKDSWQEF